MNKLILATAALCTLAFAGSAQAATKVYAEPKVGGDRLDLCLNWGEGCGKPAADAFCAKKGFTTSKGHVIAYDIGATSRTRLISTGAVCDQAFCDGFEQITCFKPSAPPIDQQAYNAPKFKGMRLDLCLDWGTGCGQPAAAKFCQMKGWTKAVAYKVANDIGGATPTRLIGTSAVCDQGFCDGFQQITCAN